MSPPPLLFSTTPPFGILCAPPSPLPFSFSLLFLPPPPKQAQHNPLCNCTLRPLPPHSGDAQPTFGCPELLEPWLLMGHLGQGVFCISWVSLPPAAAQVLFTHSSGLSEDRQGQRVEGGLLSWCLFPCSSIPCFSYPGLNPARQACSQGRQTCRLRSQVWI